MSASDDLSPAECLRLMASVPVGRIVYTLHALPAVELVSFALDGGDIVIGIDPGDTLRTAVSHAVVAFEADEVDYSSRSGWIVTVVGRSREVTDAGEIARLQAAGVTPWTSGERVRFIRIVPGIITGRRLRRPVQPGCHGEHPSAGSRARGSAYSCDGARE